MNDQHIPDISSNYSGNSLGTAVIEQKLLEITNSGILDKLSQQKYSFNSRLTWEVIYDAVMFSEKRRLHNLVGLYIESKNKGNLDNISDLLLHHFESAQNYPKTVFYGALAGDRAARMFAAEEAIHSYMRALDALMQMTDEKPVDRSLVLEKCGDVYRQSGEYQLAAEEYQSAFSAWGAASHDDEAEYVPWEITPVSRNSNLCHKISISYEPASNYDESNAWINKAIEFLPEDSQSTAPRVYAAKSAIHFRKGEYNEAIEWGERALGIAEASKNRRDLAYSHNIVATSFTRIGKLHEAIQHLKQAVAIYDKEQDFIGIGSANNNLANCYMQSDNLEYAIRHYQMALDADTKTQNDAMIAVNHNNQGEACIMQGRLDESEALFRKVIAAYKKGHAHEALAGYAMMNISRVNLYNNNLSGAGDTIEKALELIQKAGVEVIYYEAQLQHAAVILAQGKQLEEANSLCKKARQKIKALGDKLLEARADRVLARILAREGKVDLAIEEIRASIELANNIGSKFEEGKSLNEYARMLIKQGEQMKEAAESLEEAERIFSSMGAARELGYTQLLKDRLAALPE